MEGTLKVTPTALRSKSGEFDSERGQIQSLVREMSTKVNSLNSVWQGSASSAYQTSFKALEDDIAKMDKMISEHVKDLNEMADVYARAEQATETASSALPKDAIQ